MGSRLEMPRLFQTKCLELSLSGCLNETLQQDRWWVGLGETIFQKETYLRVDKQTCIQKWIQCVSAIYLRNW